LRAPPHRALKPQAQFRGQRSVDSSPLGWFIAPLHSPERGMRGREGATTISIRHRAGGAAATARIARRGRSRSRPFRSPPNDLGFEGALKLKRPLRFVSEDGLLWTAAARAGRLAAGRVGHAAQRRCAHCLSSCVGRVA
jgi:hypothetical protein